jgi:hypothetical protein
MSGPRGPLPRAKAGFTNSARDRSAWGQASCGAVSIPASRKAGGYEMLHTAGLQLDLPLAQPASEKIEGNSS